MERIWIFCIFLVGKKQWLRRCYTQPYFEIRILIHWNTDSRAQFIWKYFLTESGWAAGLPYRKKNGFGTLHCPSSFCFITLTRLHISETWAEWEKNNNFQTCASFARMWMVGGKRKITPRASSFALNAFKFTECEGYN